MAAGQIAVEQLPPLTGTVGAGVTVAVVTPAAYAHPWFGDRVQGGVSTEHSVDLYHGTAVVGLVLQRAPGADVWVEAVPGVAASMDQWADAVLRIVDRSPPVQVALLPFGADQRNEKIDDAVARLVDAGTAVVAAAGNDGKPELSFPAGLPGVVAVAAMKYAEDPGRWEPAPFTNHGDGSVGAPGVDVLTASIGESGADSEPGFSRLSGTSMSAALVAGEIAAEISRSGASPTEAAARVRTLPPGAFTSGLPWAPDADAGEPEERWELADGRTVVNDSATTEDRLGYDVYRDAIVTFLQDPNTKPPLTIGIKGKWGTGKTSLMRMVRSKLDPPQPADEDALRSIPVLGRSQERLSEYAGKDRPGVGRVLGVIRRRRAIVHPAPGASGARTTGLRASSPEGTDDGWRPTVWFNPWMYQTGDQVWAVWPTRSSARSRSG